MAGPAKCKQEWHFCILNRISCHTTFLCFPPALSYIFTNEPNSNWKPHYLFCFPRAWPLFQVLQWWHYRRNSWRPQAKLVLRPDSPTQKEKPAAIVIRYRMDPRPDRRKQTGKSNTVPRQTLAARRLQWGYANDCQTSCILEWPA